jgi:hypothetical protein
MSKEDVAAQIEAAFEDTPSPGYAFEDISATQHDEGIVAYFRNKDWRGHKVRDLRYHEAALSFFTDKAFRYWLPAFMLAELENPREADVIGEGIAFHLTRASSADARLSLFAQDELKAIAAFLNECASQYGELGYRSAERAVQSRILKP